MFCNRLRKVWTHRRKQARNQGVSCYRLYDLDLPEFPLMIDLYDQQVHAAEYKRNHTLSPEEHAEWLGLTKACISEVLGIEQESIHIKHRAVITDRSEQYGHFARSQAKLVVEEHGARFELNLSDYLDTGLFLDHRPTRQKVRAECRGLSVLNLFAYTGSFSVNAALGGASKVLTVDLSNTYLEWAQQNFRLNNLPVHADDFIAADVMAFLPELPSSSIDLIVCDPPTFSNSKKMRNVFDVQHDHPALLNECLRILKPQGKLYFSTNNRKFKLYDQHIRTQDIRDITQQTTGFDFEGKLQRRCFLLQKEATSPASQPKPNPWQRHVL
jgi:23S rRNA (cytosine1962-C5)-methyltransferase